LVQPCSPAYDERVLQPVRAASVTPRVDPKEFIVKLRLIASVLSAFLVCVLLIDSAGTAAQSAKAYTVDPGWAQLPSGTNWNGNTTWITADGKGNVMVLVRTAPYFRVFTRDGKFVKAFGADGLFESAHSVTIDAEGSLWVTDSAAHVVHKFSADGRLLNTLGKKGVAGDNTSKDLFNQPNHVAIAPNGDIYVSDGYVNARVVHFSSDGQFVRIIGGVKGSQPGQLQLPHGVALDSQGRILVNDSDNQRVSVFDKRGTFVETWAYPSRGGIAVASDDTVYISDVNVGIVNIVKNGKLIDSVSADRAHGMGVDTDGSIYVSGASRMTVMKITKGK
jgi:sugar lactone lactonase YvrE